MEGTRAREAQREMDGMNPLLYRLAHVHSSIGFRVGSGKAKAEVEGGKRV